MPSQHGQHDGADEVQDEVGAGALVQRPELGGCVRDEDEHGAENLNDLIHRASVAILRRIEPGEIQGFNHFDKADTFKVDRTIDEVDADDYDALLLPGGVGNPDILRMNEKVVRFIREFFEQGKPVAAICHGPWTLVEADVVRGRRLTSWPSIKTDIRNAGGEWVDEQVVVDRGLVTSRKPDDLPAFNAKMLEEFAEGRHEEQRQAVEAGAATS